MSKIEWTDKTWNPIAGCSIVSPGCTHCYAMKTAARLEAIDAAERAAGRKGMPHYAGLTQPSKAGPVWTGKIARASDETLTEPLRRKKPTMYFVNSMSDLFHEDVPDAWIDRVFAVMALCPQHTFQVLTKRSARMRAYCSDNEAFGRILSLANGWMAGQGTIRLVFCDDNLSGFQFPNIWLGVSAERQQEADARIPDLLATPAAVRFVSAEPLLGPIDFTKIAMPQDDGRVCSALDGNEIAGLVGNCVGYIPPLDWIIVGGESGAGARPMHPDWARSIRDQCANAGVSFFFKQWGSWLVGQHQTRSDERAWSPDVVFQDGTDFTVVSDGHDILLDAAANEQNGPTHYWKEFWGWRGHLIKKAATKSARLLDDREHNEMPSAATKTSEAA